MSQVETVRPLRRPPWLGETLGSVLVGIAAIGVVQYAVSIWWWVKVYILTPWQEGWSIPRGMLPGLLVSASAAPLLFGLFLGALLSRRRLRRRAVLVVLAVVIAVGWSVVDAWTQNYQIRVMTLNHGCEHVYFNWPLMMKLDCYICRLRAVLH